MGESENKKHLHRLGDYGQWFLESVEDYFATHQFSDVTLVVGKGRARERGNKQTLRAHALMLAAGSPVLAAKICKSRQISLDEDPNLFKIMLRYFYSGSVLCIGSQVTELKELFQRYEVGRAKELFDFGPGCCSEIVQDPEPPLEPKIETNPPCSSPSNPASGGSDRSKKSEAPPTTVQDRDLAAKNFCDENIFHLRIKTELQTEDEDTGEEDDWDPGAAMNQLMPELILQEEDETMSEIMFGFASGDNDEEETAQEGGDSVPEEGGGVVIGENGSRKKRGRPRLQDSEKGGGVSGDPLSERKDHGNHKKHLCSLCGQTLTGLTAYNRHQLIHTGARPYSCDTCGKSFTQMQRLTVHNRSHTGERPYLCSLCGKTFTESCKLKRHLSLVHKANKDGSALIPGQPVINTVENTSSKSVETADATKVVVPAKPALTPKSKRKRGKRRSGNKGPTKKKRTKGK